jgi:hypothetical protein
MPPLFLCVKTLKKQSISVNTTHRYIAGGDELKRPKSITLTFKGEEDWLYDEICKHSSRVGFIKDILKKHIPKPKEIPKK